MPLLYATIFLTGAAVLALELLASRVMAPYFGVSLYIWTGILSITLIALAAGYWWGGRLATRLAARGKGDALFGAYLLMPAVSALAIVAACLAYPYAYPTLAGGNLIAGAFAACLLLLALPLAATSAMNPLLVALLIARRGPGETAGDAGAGRVFFTSTIGSVAGVAATAFWLIPTFTNFVSLLIVAVALAALPLAALALAAPPPSVRRRLAVTACTALVASAGLLWQSDAFLGRMWPVKYAGTEWTVEARVASMFGTVKVLKSAPVDAEGRFVRVYFHDGLIQNRTLSDGTSLSFYTYALEALALSYRPDMRRTLVLGMGAGVVPSRLAKRGVEVTAVEIDPASFQVASRYFGLDLTGIRAVQADARTYLRRCRDGYDAIVVDLFHGDGTPEYLITRDFFADLKACLGPRGVAVFNTFADLTEPRGYAHFLATLRSEFPYVALYRPNDPGATHVNSFVVASATLPTPGSVDMPGVPPRYSAQLAEMLGQPRPLDRELLAGGEIVTDARASVAADLARIQLGYRRSVAQEIPPAFLIN